MIFDAHVHVNTGVGTDIGYDSNTPCQSEAFAVLLKNRQLGILANAASVAEYEALKELEGAHISFGIHPWDAEKFCRGDEKEELSKGDPHQLRKMVYEKLAALKSYFADADVIGEIGMDSLWCSCDLKLQHIIFAEQLEIAEQLKKPVILHTKGCEMQIAEMLKAYRMPKVVHWYSCSEYLEKYMELDCYFTVGPDYNQSAVAKEIINRVSLDRLLVETDGIDAVEWAIGGRVQVLEIPEVLMGAVTAIAASKTVSITEAERVLQNNIERLIKNH